MRGAFISLEGLEGVGKTTSLDFLKNEIESAGKSLVISREPGGTELGEKLRDLLLHANTSISAESELMMMATSRKQHLDDVIEPALSRGQWVISDRYIDASFAYQGGGRELGLTVVAELHRLMNVNVLPDMTILLDMPILEGLKRMSKRGSPDRIEKEELAFFERARAAYLQRAADDTTRIKVIDASLSIKDVQAQLQQHVHELLKSHRD